MRRTTTSFLVVLLAALGACMGAPEPDGPFFSFLKERKAWQATRVEMTVIPASGTSARAGGDSSAGGGDEMAVSLVATHEPSGETLTFFVWTDRLEGTRPVKVFGSLADMDDVLGRERLLPVSNACTPGDRTASSGTLTFEDHDPNARTLSGSFIANVCRVDDANRAWTLADGKFRDISYLSAGS